MSKSIPWGVPNLYQFHSNPEQLDHYGELRYLPSQDALDELSNYYENWSMWADDEASEGDPAREEWTSDYLIDQVSDDSFNHDYEIRRGGSEEDYPRGALFDYTTEQLNIMHYYLMTHDDNERLTVQNFTEFYDRMRKNGAIG